MATAVQQSPTKTFSFAKYRGALQRGPRLPSLVEHLKTDGFDLVPNHPRPLVGRTVASARDEKTGRRRRVTDYERAARAHLGERAEMWRPAELEEIGREYRQVWYGEVDGVRIRVNEFFNDREHWGLQHASLCKTCSRERWNNANGRACPLCKKCQAPRKRPETPMCPKTGLVCSTVYKRKPEDEPCRCQTCRDWNADKHRRLYAKRALAESNPCIRSKAFHLRAPQLGKPTPLAPNAGVRTANTWCWLPETLLESLERYEIKVNAAWEHFERAALADSESSSQSAAAALSSA